MDTRFPGTVTSSSEVTLALVGVQRRHTLFHRRFLAISITLPATADH
jgi:hypothetical protein